MVNEKYQVIAGQWFNDCFAIDDSLADDFFATKSRSYSIRKSNKLITSLEERLARPANFAREIFFTCNRDSYEKYIELLEKLKIKYIAIPLHWPKK